MSGDEFNKTEQDILNYALGDEAKDTSTKDETHSEETDDTTQDTEESQTETGSDDSESTDEDSGGGDGSTEEVDAQPKKPDDKSVESSGDKQPKQLNKGDANEVKHYQNHITSLQTTNKNLKTMISERDRKIQSVIAENEGYKASLDNLKGLGVAEVKRVTEIAAMYKTDPLRAVTEFLIGAKQDGVDLSKLDLGTIDTDAIRRLIQSEVGGRIDPLVQRYSQQDRDTEAQAAASQELEAFISVYPQAENHLDAVARIMEVAPELSLREAWVKIREYALDNGIDLNAPLGGNASTDQQAKKASTVKALPNGGRQLSGNSGNSLAQPRKPNAPKPVGTDLNEIIVESMREAGFANYRR